jgi:hypothetical protein
MTDDLFQARTTDPETSHIAAANLNHFDMKPVERILFNILKHGPMTDEELYGHYMDYIKVYDARLKRSPSAIRTLRHKMHKDDLIYCTGIGKSNAGNPSRLWKAKEL